MTDYEFITAQCQKFQFTKQMFFLGLILSALCFATMTAATGKGKRDTFYVTDRICLKRDASNYAHCYANGKPVVFQDECMDEGVLSMKARVIGRYAYVVGSLDANILGFAGNFMLYRIDTLDFSVKHIGNFAAIHFHKNGFKAVTAKIINPDASCSAEWIFDMRECVYNKNGNLVRNGKRINGYEELEKEYGRSLINAVGLD